MIYMYIDVDFGTESFFHTASNFHFPAYSINRKQIFAILLIYCFIFLYVYSSQGRKCAKCVLNLLSIVYTQVS